MATRNVTDCRIEKASLAAMADLYGVQVVFQTIGIDDRIPKLNEATCCPVYNQARTLDTDEGAQHFVELLVVSHANDQETAISEAEDWLTRHTGILRDLSARKKIEIQTTIEPEMGCKSLSLPHGFLSLLADLTCDFSHQYSRALSVAELEERRRQGKRPP
jgi:hypothetical protein